MDAPDTLAAVRAAGIKLTAEGVAIRATPRSALTDELRAHIRANRAAILAALRLDPESEREAREEQAVTAGKRSISEKRVADKEAREERAAILQFCAGYSRAEAERVAGLLH